MHPVKFLSRGRGGGLWLPAGLLFKDATKIQNGHKRSAPKIFVNQKLKSGDVRGFTKIQNGRHG